MGTEQSRARAGAVSCNSKSHAREYFFLRHGYHVWEDSSVASDHVEEITPIKVGLLKKIGTKSQLAMQRQVALWSNRIEYSQINKPVVGFMPVYGAEVSEVEGEPTFFRLRDGFNNSVVDHIFVASTPREKAIWVEAISQAIATAAPLKISIPLQGSEGDSIDGSVGNESNASGLRSPSDGVDGAGGSASVEADSMELGNDFAVDLPPGEVLELTRDQFRTMRNALANDNGTSVMKTMNVTPVDRPFYVDSDDHKVWLNPDLYGGLRSCMPPNVCAGALKVY
eukprot:INCI4232.1.p1 GENE.INCI4232.1~~INCI4232.1.p1  ORF type:complete len:282 (-),score=48.29 INCI4232.1:321-1166(-)